MGFLGGAPVDWFLNRYYPGGQGLPMPDYDPFKMRGVSKIAHYFGQGIFEELKGKTVVDFGCGPGDNAIDLAAAGCEHVIGLDMQERFLEQGRAEAARRGLSDRVEFVQKVNEKVDAIISTDAFEHFGDPADILRIMRSILKDGGQLIVEFGYTWFHPLGGHTFSVFPWSHLIFTEKALMKWRNTFKSDGATQFHEIAGGLNRMTLGRWEKLVEESDFRFQSYRMNPIRNVRWLHHKLTREWTTSVIIARLVPK